MVANQTDPEGTLPGKGGSRGLYSLFWQFRGDMCAVRTDFKWVLVSLQLRNNAYPALLCPALPCPALPCPAPPCPALKLSCCAHSQPYDGRSCIGICLHYVDTKCDADILVKHSSQLQQWHIDRMRASAFAIASVARATVAKTKQTWRCQNKVNQRT